MEKIFVIHFSDQKYFQNSMYKGFTQFSKEKIENSVQKYKRVEYASLKIGYLNKQ